MLYENYKHSASSGNLFLDNLSAFVWRYGLKNWGKDSARANMGKAAEQAVYAALESGATPKQARDAAQAIFDKMSAGEVHNEREAVGPIAERMLQALLDLGGKFERRPKEAREVHNLGKRVSFEVDLFHDSGIIDLKATMRMPWAEGKPPSPHAGHIRQQGLYGNLTGLQVSLLYATPKRCELYRVPQEDAERGARSLFDAFEQIERWDLQFPTPEQAMRFIPLSTDDFYWDDPEATDAARKMWRDAGRIAA